MKKTAALIIVMMLTAINIFPQRIIGYFNSGYSGMPVSAIPFRSLTHVCHAFLRPNSDGTLFIQPGFLSKELIDRAHHDNVMVLVSLGGWDTLAAKNFRTLAAKPSSRAKFVTELTNLCRTNQYDGADIDWEFPDNSHADNFVSLISELRKSFRQAGIPLLAAALPSQDYRNGFDVQRLSSLLDWFSIMTYDFAGAWQMEAYHNSPLYSTARQSMSVDNSVQYYLKKGIPKAKLLIGVAFYGYMMNAMDMYQKLLDKNVPSITYPAADSIKKSSFRWTYNWDNTAMVPYLQNKSKMQIISYDDPSSIRLKCEYVKNNSLGGVILWELHKDYNGKRSPLMDVVSKTLPKPKASSRNLRP